MLTHPVSTAWRDPVPQAPWSRCSETITGHQLRFRHKWSRQTVVGVKASECDWLKPSSLQVSSVCLWLMMITTCLAVCIGQRSILGTLSYCIIRFGKSQPEGCAETITGFLEDVRAQLESNCSLSAISLSLNLECAKRALNRHQFRS